MQLASPGAGSSSEMSLPSVAPLPVPSNLSPGSARPLPPASDLEQRWLESGIRAAREGRKDAAREAFCSALALCSDRPQTWLWLASVAERPTEAIECLEHTLAVDPGNPKAINWLARLRVADAMPQATTPHGSSAENATIARILVVEDSATVRQILVALLTEEGFGVQTAGSGIEALSLFRNVCFQAILLDFTLPGMDGRRVLEILGKHERTRRLPIFLLSGDFKEKDRQLYQEMGAAECFSKPLDKPKLLASLIRAVGAPTRRIC